MSRRRKAERRIIAPDPVYNSRLVSMIINKTLIEGKKNTAQHIFYESMKRVKESIKQDPLETLQKAINNITPIVELKSRRIGGATYQVPIEINTNRGMSLALRFLIKAARNRPGRNMTIKLGNEIIDAYNNTGNAVKKKEELHKQADANKSFASFKF